MDILEQDPLSHLFNNQSPSVNKRGRPHLTEVIRFHPQPKSIISQILCQAKASINKKSLLQKAASAGEDHLDNCSKSEDHSITTIQNTLKIKPFKKHGYNNRTNKRKCHINTLISKSLIDDIQDSSTSKERESKCSCDFPNCTYSCKLMSNLLKHKRIHTNERPYLCDQCTFRSNFVNSLKVHKRTHTSDRPYCCEHCGHRCNSISNLKKHWKQKHCTVKSL